MINQYLSQNELAVMQALWNSGKALSRPEILDAIENNDWNPNSIHLVLNNLIEKGFVEVSGITRCGRGYGRTYKAVKTRIGYGAGLALDVISANQNSDSIVDMVSTMVRESEADNDTIARLEEMLSQYRKEINKDS